MGETQHVVPISKTLRGHYSHMLKESNVRETLREGNQILAYKSRKRRKPMVKRSKPLRTMTSNLYPSKRLKDLSSIFGIVEKSGVRKEIIQKKRKGDFNELEEDDLFTAATKMRNKKKLMSTYTFRGDNQPLSGRRSARHSETKSARGSMVKSSSYLSLSTFDSASDNLLSSEGMQMDTWDAGDFLETPTLYAPTSTVERPNEEIELAYGDMPLPYKKKKKKKRSKRKKKKRKKEFWEILDEEEEALMKSKGKLEYFKPPPSLYKDPTKISPRRTYKRAATHIGFHRPTHQRVIEQLPKQHFMEQTIASKNQKKQSAVDKLQQILHSPSNPFVDDTISELTLPELENEKKSKHQWNVSTPLPKIKSETPSLSSTLPSTTSSSYYAELNFVKPATKLKLKSTLTRQNSMMMDPLSPVFDPTLAQQQTKKKVKEEEQEDQFDNLHIITDEEEKIEKPILSRFNSKLSLKVEKQSSIVDLMAYFKAPTKKEDDEQVEDLLPPPIQSFIMNSSLMPAVKDHKMKTSQGLGRLTRSPQFNNSYESLTDLLKGGSNRYLQGTIASQKKRRTYHPGSPNSPNAHQQRKTIKKEMKAPAMHVDSKRIDINDYSKVKFQAVFSPHETPVEPPSTDYLRFLDE